MKAGWKMKAYMAYSRTAGQSEAAVLIFANSVKEAKRIGWSSVLYEICDNEYIDIGINQMKDSPWVFAEMKSDKPHVVEDPECCSQCESWGSELIDGICQSCGEIICTEQ